MPMKKNQYDVVVTQLNPGVDHASIRLANKEVAYCFLSDDGLLVFVGVTLHANPPPSGLDTAIGQLVITHCSQTQLANGGLS